jgi:hypothetical protein
MRCSDARTAFRSTTLKHIPKLLEGLDVAALRKEAGLVDGPGPSLE